MQQHASANDWDTLGRTAFGEARGEPFNGIVGVCWVVMNRYKAMGWYGHTIHDVCLKPLQFSCWNADDPNRIRIETVGTQDPAFRRCLGIAALVMSEDLDDPTGSAVNYHSTSIHPDWADRMIPTITIGNHRFYREID